MKPILTKNIPWVKPSLIFKIGFGDGNWIYQPIDCASITEIFLVIQTELVLITKIDFNKGNWDYLPYISDLKLKLNFTIENEIDFKSQHLWILRKPGLSIDNVSFHN